MRCFVSSLGPAVSDLGLRLRNAVKARVRLRAAKICVAYVARGTLARRASIRQELENLCSHGPLTGTARAATSVSIRSRLARDLAGSRKKITISQHSLDKSCQPKALRFSAHLTVLNNPEPARHSQQPKRFAAVLEVLNRHPIDLGADWKCRAVDTCLSAALNTG